MWKACQSLRLDGFIQLCTQKGILPFFLPLVVLIDINERMLRYCLVLSRNQNNENDSNNKKTEQTYLIY